MKKRTNITTQPLNKFLELVRKHCVLSKPIKVKQVIVDSENTKIKYGSSDCVMYKIDVYYLTKLNKQKFYLCRVRSQMTIINNAESNIEKKKYLKESINNIINEFQESYFAGRIIRESAKFDDIEIISRNEYFNLIKRKDAKVI